MLLPEEGSRDRQMDRQTDRQTRCTRDNSLLSCLGTALGFLSCGGDAEGSELPPSWDVEQLVTGAR